MLLQHTVSEMRGLGVSRIESLFVSVDSSCLAGAFESRGFRTHWRELLGTELCPSLGPVDIPAIWEMEAWQPGHWYEAATLLQAAYEAGVEAEIHQPYRSVEGCRRVLDGILHQASCGMLIPQASAMVRHRGRGVGLVVVTEVGPRQAHLPQIAVLPAYQRRGLGRLLLEYSRQQLSARQFAALSLFVSRANQRAGEVYRAMGFRPVLEFPVFIWDR
jgi:ribosomal protein S18 acetylase RimI-like enzyme